MTLSAINIHDELYNKGKGLRLFLVLSFCIVMSFGFAQSMEVASFKWDEADQTANLSPTMRYDINGDKCALIKVVTTQKDFNFEVGMLGVTEVEMQNSDHPSEIWVYVSEGTMRISIQHPQLGSIKDYYLGQRLKKGRTYVLELTTDQIGKFTVDWSRKQFLDVEIVPSSASMYINGMKLDLDKRGMSSIELPFGTHTYRIEADAYHPVESEITINDPDKHHNLRVQLPPAFGYLNVEVTPESAGGELYVDDERVGVLPINHYPLKSGSHELMVKKSLYLPSYRRVEMTDNQTVTLTPEMHPNYAEYEISVDGDKEAQIYDDGILLGEGRWKGLLEAGTHTIEAKREKHYPTTMQVEVMKDIPRKVSLPRPTPIYGTLEILTQPSDAMVYIDGSAKPSGKTHYRDDHLLIGRHSVKIVKAGHQTKEFEVEIKESEPERIELTLTDYCESKIFTKPTGASVSLDGRDLGYAPVRLNCVRGNYRVKVFARGYTTFSKNMRLDGTTPDSIIVKLSRNYIRPNEFYMQAGYNFGNISALNFGMGAYIGNFNIEGNYFLGLGKSEDIYWSDTAGEVAPFIATYKPHGAKVKLGYGIRLHHRIRLTPQVGCQILSLKESITELYPNWIEAGYSKYPTTAAHGANAFSATFGMRLTVAVAKCLALSFTPEYMMNVKESPGFKVLSGLTPSIGEWAKGLGYNINLILFF